MSPVAAPSANVWPSRVFRAGPPSAVRVVWIDFPDELRHVAEPYLMRELPLLPRWVVELRVQYDANDEGAMWANVSAEYRTGRIGICGSWFSCTEQFRRSAIRHEFAHFALDGISAFASRLIKTMEEDSQGRVLLTDELRRMLECSTCDVEEMLRAALEMERDL